MKFQEIQDKNYGLYDFFTFEEVCYKEFIALSINEYLEKNANSPWRFYIEDKRFNSYPNFMFKHPLCISHKNFDGSTFSFKICSEDNINSFGYRLFIDAKDDEHFDFINQDITQTDKLAMLLKGGILSEFECISKCGWWITDIWKNMYKISAQSQSESFFDEIFAKDFTAKMLQINEKLILASDSKDVQTLLTQLKTKG